jgi:hypothetical protein
MHGVLLFGSRVVNEKTPPLKVSNGVPSKTKAPLLESSNGAAAGVLATLISVGCNSLKSAHDGRYVFSLVIMALDGWRSFGSSRAPTLILRLTHFDPSFLMVFYALKQKNLVAKKSATRFW